MTRISRVELAQRIAADIPEGSYVNLGIGAPTLVANFLPQDQEIVLHTETACSEWVKRPCPTGSTLTSSTRESSPSPLRREPPTSITPTPSR
jgi:acyl CoA:acetate/3-ketoacid CoA transferase beta subunit